MKMLKRHRSFGGWTDIYEHQSSSTRTAMRFAVYVPERAARGERCPVVYFLSGLTCTEENFITKSGVQQHAAAHGLVVVAPDTSPRGAGVPGEDATWDFGTGAGFYVNATEPAWSANYRMYDYVQTELPTLVESHFPIIPDRRGIMGHSMGGHGALVVALREPARWRSVSAFSPICAPCEAPWGQKAFSGYLGEDRSKWADYDASLLVRKPMRDRRPILVDQGAADEFLANQLMPEALRTACAAVDHPLELRMRDGYDHSYYFIATFMGEHVAHHARALGAH